MGQQISHNKDLMVSQCKTWESISFSEGKQKSLFGGNQKKIKGYQIKQKKAPAKERKKKKQEGTKTTATKKLGKKAKLFE